MAKAKTKTPPRGAGGRFVKSKSTAVARSAPRMPARVQYTTVEQFVAGKGRAAPTKKRRKAGSGGGKSLIPALKARVKPVAASAAYAWIMVGDSSTAGKIREVVKKVPVVEAIGEPLTHGILSTFIATKTKGTVREVFDNLAFAALMRGGWNLGASNFDLGKAAKVSGYDEDLSGDDDLSGEIDDDEAGAYDEDEIRGDDDLSGDDWDQE